MLFGPSREHIARAELSPPKNDELCALKTYKAIGIETFQSF